MYGHANFLDLEQIKFYQRLQDDFLDDLENSQPPSYNGRGIVVCGGGISYFTCAWICINILRKLGCKLPVELWHLDDSEMTDEMRSIIKSLNVKVINASNITPLVSARVSGGWELKPYAILNSSFEEVLLLDADNVCVRNPEYLFSDVNYLDTGVIFWPDYLRLADNREIWSICRVPYQDEPEFETGQILVHKSRCWKALKLTMHLNEYSNFYYQYIHGDKETFHMAWRILNLPYSMPKHPIHRLRGVMCQHDFHANRIFQHRNMAKWSFYSENPTIPGFQHEDECMEFLTQLREIWIPKLLTPRYDSKRRNAFENAMARNLCDTSWSYHRVGYDHREMSFSLEGLVNIGAAFNEYFWDIMSREETLTLTLSSEKEVTCRLIQDTPGIWRGPWLIDEQMVIELRPRLQSFSLF